MAGYFGHDLGLTLLPISISRAFSFTVRWAGRYEQSRKSCQNKVEAKDPP
jgi:hypothetical protein